IARRPRRSPLFPYTTLFRSRVVDGAREPVHRERRVELGAQADGAGAEHLVAEGRLALQPGVLVLLVAAPRDRVAAQAEAGADIRDRKSTRLNSSHVKISYAV